MSPAPLTLDLPTPEATAALARALAARLHPGDVLTLSGGIGAGKTHFARALIHARLRTPEDVPSPTFTLVQVYDTPGAEIWHSDLYRLSGPDEIEELGLAEAFETAICLVEWPDRGGDLIPDHALALSFADAGGDARRVTLTWQAPRWETLVREALSAMATTPELPDTTPPDTTPL